MIKIAAMVGAPDLQKETLAVYSGNLAEAFQNLAALGYDGVELMTRDPSRLDAAQIQGWLSECNLELAGLCSGHVFGEDGLGLVDPDPEICRQALERLKRFVDFASLFGEGTLVNIGRSRGPGFPEDPQATLSRMETAFRELAEYAHPQGVRIVLEPINVHQANFIHTTQEGIDMVQRVNHPSFGLMLDVYHMNIEDVDIYTSFREARDTCWFVHLTENNRKWPGSAHLDFERITAVLKEIEYAGFVSLEILPWPDPDTAAKSSIDFLRRLIPRE